MIAEHFDTFTRVLIERPSRRGMLHAIASDGLAAIVGAPLVGHDIAAKNKHGKKRKKHKKKQHNQAAPRTTADAACQLSWWGSLAGDRRYAQTFRALRSGQLTSAAIGLTYNGEGAAFNLAIRELDPGGKPGYVLASTQISDVPATNLDVPPIDSGPTRTIVGAFATPATVVAGQVYALTLTLTEPGTGTGSNWPLSMQANSSNPCPDGMLFTDKSGDGAFHPQEGWDLAFSTEVTA